MNGYQHVVEMLGRRFGRYTVIGRAPNHACGAARWVLRCDCGATNVKRGNRLRAGKGFSCRACRASMGYPDRRKDLTGVVLGTFTLERDIGNVGRVRLWQMRCQCGEVGEISTIRVRSYQRRGWAPRCDCGRAERKFGPVPRPGRRRGDPGRCTCCGEVGHNRVSCRKAA